MRDLRIDVGVETVLLGRHPLPGGRRLFTHETDAHDGFDAFEAVLPRDYQAERRTVLIRKHPTVHPDRQQRQRMHRLIHSKRFDIGPIDQRKVATHAWHLLRSGQGFESDILRSGGWLETPDQFGQREAEPGNDHRPGFDATQAIDTLLELARSEQFLHRILPRTLDFAIHHDGPGLDNHARSISCRIPLARAELVKIVVMRGVTVRRKALVLWQRLPARMTKLVS